MSQLIEKILRDISADDRISDGIFRIENDTHMGVLRDYFVKHGLTHEAAVHVSNRMTEGKFPEKQAYNRDGILCTFPTPQHKARAIARGTHFEKNPVPQVQQQRDAAKQEEPPQAPPGSKPEPGELPPDDEDDKDTEKDTDDDIGGGGGSHGGGGSSGGGDGEGGGSVFQGDTQLEVEPPRGQESDAPPQPPQPTVPPAARTPQRVAAEKEIVRQILGTDDTTLSNIGGPIGVNEELHKQLQELFKKADELGLREAIKFLTPYVKP